MKNFPQKCKYARQIFRSNGCGCRFVANVLHQSIFLFLPARLCAALLAMRSNVSVARQEHWMIAAVVSCECPAVIVPSLKIQPVIEKLICTLQICRTRLFLSRLYLEREQSVRTIIFPLVSLLLAGQLIISLGSFMRLKQWEKPA